MFRKHQSVIVMVKNSSCLFVTLWIFLSFPLQSCIQMGNPLKTYLKQNADIKWGDLNGSLNIRTDGFYLSEDSLGGLIFYDDGTVANFIISGFSMDSLRKDMTKVLKHYLKKGDWGWQDVGVMKKIKDTLEVNFYPVDVIFFKKYWRYAQKQKFYIKDSTTLQITEYRMLGKGFSHIPSKGSLSTFNFIPANNIPLPDAKLKTQKWLWRHETDWKNYMEKKKHRSELEY